MRSMIGLLFLGLIAAQGPPTVPAVKQVPLALAYQSDFNRLLRQFQTDVEVLRLRACADVGLHYSKCIVRWDQGTVAPDVTPTTTPEEPEPEKR